MTVNFATRDKIKDLAKAIMEKVQDPNCSGTELRELVEDLGKTADEFLWGIREPDHKFTCKTCQEYLAVYHEGDGEHTVSRTLEA